MKAARYGVLVEANPATGVLVLTCNKGTETVEFQFVGSDRHSHGPAIRVGQWLFDPARNRLWVRVPLTGGGDVCVEFTEVTERKAEDKTEA